MSILSVKNLNLYITDKDAKNIKNTHSNARTYLVENLNFTLKAKHTLGIVGESGSGKTLTALAICQLLAPEVQREAEEIVFLSQDINLFSSKNMENVLGKDIGFVFQEPMSSLNPLHTIGRQIEELLKQHTSMNSSARSIEVNGLLKKVGLENIEYNRLPHTLSGGQRQRVMIAMAIACKPKLLILDEPTTALDVTVAKQILNLLKALQAELGLAMIFISHDLHVIKYIADDVIVMKLGKICEQGKTQDILSNPQHDYTKALIKAHPEGEAVAINTNFLNQMPLIKVEGLSVCVGKKKWFSKKVPNIILQPSFLSLAKGEALGIVGESGSGKTTLALAILRLIKSTGSVLYLGQSVLDFDQNELKMFRKTAQIVFQDPMASLNPRMMIKDIIGEGLKVHYKDLSKIDYDHKIKEILQDVGLDESCLTRYPHAFSGGQRQRINLARALILKPQVIVLDEPTSALDLLLQKQMIAVLKNLQSKYGLSYLFISHDLSVIKAICHRVIVLKNGNIIEENITSALFNNPQHPYTQSLIEAAFFL